MKQKAGITYLACVISAFTSMSYANVIATSSSEIIELDYGYHGALLNSASIQDFYTYDGQTSAHELNTQNPPNWWQAFDFNQENWVRTDVASGTIKAYAENTDPQYDESLHGEVPATRITHVSSVISYEDISLTIFEDNTEVDFHWGIDGILNGLAGFGAAMDVAITHVESEQQVNQNTLKYDYTFNSDHHDQSQSEMFVDEQLDLNFILDAGTYNLSLGLGFIAASVSGYISDYSYLYGDETIVVIPPEGFLYYSRASRADLSHTATFDITSPTMENLSLDSPNFPALLTPQVASIIAAGGGPNSVNAPQNKSQIDPTNPQTFSVPEPTTLAIFASALIWLRLRRR